MSQRGRGVGLRRRAEQRAGPRAGLRPGHINLSDQRLQREVIHWMAMSATSSLSSSSQSTAEHSQSPAVASPPASSSLTSREWIEQSGFHAPQMSLPEELFSDSFSSVLLNPLSNVGDEEFEDTTLCSDAQNVMEMEGVVGDETVSVPLVSPKLTSVLVQGDSDDDDETQIPEVVVDCTVESTPAVLVSDTEAEAWEEASLDDDVIDPDWQPNLRRSSEGEEEAVGRGRGRGRVVRQSETTTASSARKSAARAARKVPSKVVAHSRTSAAWEFFDTAADSKTDVICKLCRKRYSRGKNPLNLSSSVMTRHLSSTHALLWQRHVDKVAGRMPAKPSAAKPSAAASSSSSLLHLAARRPMTVLSEPAAVGASVSTPAAEHSPLWLPTSQSQPGLTPPSPARSVESTPYSTLSGPSSQVSVPQMWEHKQPWPPTHAKAKKLNCGLARLLATQMLPFQLVEAEEFRSFVALACPRYKIPSRHFFARKAVPELHNHVVSNITRSLKNSVSKSVHFTTDTWTSKHGQGKYISLTAHWVNLVAARAQGDGAALQVLKSPRLEGQPPSSSSSFTSTPSTSQQEGTLRPHCAATALRRQAVLHLRSLGDRSHTAEELWAALSADFEHWLTPLHLAPGMVVSDNAANLLAAIRLGKLTHVPCMAHVLNLIVQRFIREYPGLQSLLKEVRALCAHFRRSNNASRRLSVLQRSLGLSEQRLLCDVPTRWNSTLHMLQRLCHQQKAIVQYVMNPGLLSADVVYFTPSQWAQLKDLITVLHSFDYATNMVSADDAVISMAVPVIYLLEQALRALRTPVQAQVQVEEEAEEEEEEGAFGISGPQSSGMAASGAHTETGEAETAMQGEDEEMATLLSGEGEEHDSSSFVRGWLEEESVDSPVVQPTLATGLGAQGSVSHMSAFMLHFVQNDPRVLMIWRSTHYWLTTLLDPRYKARFSEMIPAQGRESRMAEYRLALFKCLIKEYPAGQTGTVHRPEAGGSTRSSSSSSSAGRTVDFGEMWSTFWRPARTEAAESSSRQEHHVILHRMVQEYLAVNFEGFMKVPEPFEFWASKLDQWPELAKYAIHVLSCPTASVLSERVFSAAGSVLTDRRTRLSPDSVDRLTIIKMNKTWISPDFDTPSPEVDE